MQNVFAILDNRLKPFEDFCFTWLVRVFLAAALVGSAWIDDAPPLELSAYIITAYVALRLIMQFPVLMDLVPFDNKALKILIGIISMIVFVFSFIVIANIVGEIAFMVIND